MGQQQFVRGKKKTFLPSNVMPETVSTGSEGPLVNDKEDQKVGCFPGFTTRAVKSSRKKQKSAWLFECVGSNFYLACPQGSTY